MDDGRAQDVVDRVEQWAPIVAVILSAAAIVSCVTWAAIEVWGAWK